MLYIFINRNLLFEYEYDIRFVFKRMIDAIDRCDLRYEAIKSLRHNPIMKIIVIIITFVFFMLMIGGYSLLFPDKDKYGNDVSNYLAFDIYFHNNNDISKLPLISEKKSRLKIIESIALG